VSAGDPLRAWQAKLARIAATGLGDALGRALAAVALDAEAEAKLLATSRLRVRTGALRRSIRATVRGATLALHAGEQGGAPLKYAGLQLLDRETTITPKRGQYLAQPVGPALTGAGVARHRSPRQVPGLHFVRSKAGKALLVDNKGSVWYVLHRSVKIKGKRVLNDAIETARRALPLSLADEIKVELLGRPS
jgi:hypothetical protein